jgi:twinkle protein
MSEIQEIKTKYGSNAESIISKGLGLNQVGSKYRCPNNHAHKNNDRNPSMSWDNALNQFHCFGCGMNIDLYGYYREHLNYTHQEVLRELLDKQDYTKTSMQQKRDSFITEKQKLKPITRECVDYIKTRGISENTIKAFKLVSYENEIVFPYFRYETLVGGKKRKPIPKPSPKCTSLIGSKPYLFNSENIDTREDLIICEGEFDCMAIYECGFQNVVSVGAGANSLSAMLEQAEELLNKFNNLIIVSDNDQAGEEMDKVMLERYKDKIKLIDKKLYTENDINEELLKHGKEKVMQIIESAILKIEGRRDLDQSPYKGIDKRTGSYISTGIPTIDNAINDLAPGCVTLIAGRSNGGKTTFTKQIIANAINKGNKVYIISGEGDQETFINEIYQCVIGRESNYYNIIKINKRFHKEPKPYVLQALQKWHKNKLTIFNKGDSKMKSIEQLFEMVEKEAKIKNPNLIVIDNLMSVLSASSTEKYEKQAEFVQRCHDIATNYRLHIILVLHPNKTYSKGNDLDLEHISGSMDIPNKADNVITVIREYDNENIVQGINGKLAVMKNRYYPDLVQCNVHFEKETGLLVELKECECVSYSFNWEKYLKDNEKVVDWISEAKQAEQMEIDEPPY